MLTRPIQRGCGYRQAGGAYLVTETSPFGLPVEHFLIDPPRMIDAEEIGLSAIGVMPFKHPDAPDTHHVLNWVGEDNYPNTCDFVEEGRRFGFSTRIASNFDFSLLGIGSRIWHVHKRAHIVNSDEYLLRPPYHPGLPLEECPKMLHELVTDIPEMCVRYWWQDITDSEPVMDEGDARYVRRNVGDTTYYGFTCPEGITPQYHPAVFMWLPIHAVEVVRDEASGTHEATMGRINATQPGVDVRLVDF